MLKVALMFRAAVLCYAAGPAYIGLPWGAVIVETKPISAGVRANRALILWMRNPERHELVDPYPYQDMTLGSYYLGRTRVSLVDTATRRVINSLPVRWDRNDAKDEFGIPYKIYRGYYHVPEVDGDEERGKPEILYLRDFKGDGQALEFAFFEAAESLEFRTTLYGYSPKQDRVIQYCVELENVDDGSVEDLVWVNYLFSREQDAPGHWKYEIDYRGRGGCLMKYDVRYDAPSERFRGTIAVICPVDQYKK